MLRGDCWRSKVGDTGATGRRLLGRGTIGYHSQVVLLRKMNGEETDCLTKETNTR